MALDALKWKLWKATYLEAFVWTYNDDCYCYQPMIEKITPNFKAGYPFVNRDVVWRGTFKTDPSPPEITFLKRQFQREAFKHGISVDEPNWYGKIVWTATT
jgi:hypothetical protein